MYEVIGNLLEDQDTDIDVVIKEGDTFNVLVRSVKA